jgi:nitroimidazol reductase NimA-like FMN-containing flavoprotein (pyridoxamine 5'-phosphate oxidase superfamily)
MNIDRKQILDRISGLFATQRLAVLSTQKNNQPYSSLVAFASSPDLESFYLLTPNTTRKYENLTANPKVSILVNDSQNSADDIYTAVSVTGTGVAEVVEKDRNGDALDIYLKKHPHLKDFSSAPTSAFIRIIMKRYFMVNRFQNVVEIKIEP